MKRKSNIPVITDKDINNWITGATTLAEALSTTSNCKQSNKSYASPIERISNWNKLRHNSYDTKTESMLLLEEVLELYEGNPKQKSKELINELKIKPLSKAELEDSYLDIIFVAVGSLTKLGYSSNQINDMLHIVCDVNDMKGLQKDENGKIVKNPQLDGEDLRRLQKYID